MRRHRVPRSRSPRRIARSTTSPACCRPTTIVKTEATIDAIEQRTGAEVVVYTQDAGTYGLSTEETEAKARALIDQWGIGRAGFNDGMVIFFDLDPSLEHGQVQLYAAPGFEAAYLSNSERQGDLRQRHAAVPAQRRLRWRARHRDGARRCGRDPRTCQLPAARPPGQRRGRAHRRADRVLRARRLGRPVLAPVRQGPGLSRRSRRS